MAYILIQMPIHPSLYSVSFSIFLRLFYQISGEHPLRIPLQLGLSFCCLQCLITVFLSFFLSLSIHQPIFNTECTVPPSLSSVIFWQWVVVSLLRCMTFICRWLSLLFYTHHFSFFSHLPFFHALYNCWFVSGGGVRPHVLHWHCWHNPLWPQRLLKDNTHTIYWIWSSFFTEQVSVVSNLWPVLSKNVLIIA